MSKAGRTALLIVLVATTVGCDRITKHLASAALAGTPMRSYLGDTVRLEYAENTGGFLGLGSDLQPVLRTAIFTVGTALILVLALISAYRLHVERSEFIGITLAFAGGVSNLIDRILFGSVVDFLNVGVGSLRTGIFNIADMAVMLGILLIGRRIFERSKEDDNGTSQA